MKSRIAIAIVLSVCLFSRADWRLDFDEEFAQLFGGSTAWTPAALNPVAWWSFESTNGSVNADSINGKIMTLVGSPAVDTGIRGNCITTAAGKYGSFSAFSETNVFSISLWAKTATPTDNSVLVGSATSANVYVNKNMATLMRIKTKGTLPAFVTPSFGTDWRMVTITCDGTNARVFIDGIESSSGALTLTSPSIAAFNQIGRFSSGTTLAWNGQIDELTFYNYALSQAQITQLYNYK